MTECLYVLGTVTDNFNLKYDIFIIYFIINIGI